MRQLPAVARIGAIVMMCFLVMSCSTSDTTPMLASEPTATAIPLQNTRAPSTPTAAATPAMQPSTSPLAPGNPAEETSDAADVMPLQESEMLVFHGESEYGPDYPDWEASYDPAIWMLGDVEGLRNPSLIHREIDNCNIWLSAGPMGATPLGKTEISGREWKLSRLRASVLGYFSPYEGGGYFFDVSLPEDYSAVHKTPCQADAEKVIETFLIVEE